MVNSQVRSRVTVDAVTRAPIAVGCSVLSHYPALNSLPGRAVSSRRSTTTRHVVTTLAVVTARGIGVKSSAIEAGSPRHSRKPGRKCQPAYSRNQAGSPDSALYRCAGESARRDRYSVRDQRRKKRSRGQWGRCWHRQTVAKQEQRACRKGHRRSFTLLQ